MTKEQNSKQQQLLSILLTFGISLAGGGVFYLLQLPLHWLLGAMTATLGASTVFKIKLYWPIGLRNVGLIFIGYMLGSAMTLQTLKEMFQQLPSMLLVTIAILLLCVAFAFLVTKVTGISFRSTLTGSIPGGLSQMIVLGEEIKGIDLTIVTFFQITRLISVIFIVPLLVLSPLFGKGNATGLEFIPTNSAQWAWWTVILFVVVTVGFAFLGKFIKMPTAFLLGPIIGTAIVSVAVGIQAPDLPTSVIDFSQILMGAYIGLMIKPAELENKIKAGTAAVVTGIALIFFSMVIGSLLVAAHNLPYVTAFLSMAPGGMAQMGIVAKEADANLTIITGYQMFRVFFILFLVPPVLKWLLTRPWMDRIGNRRRQH